MADTENYYRQRLGEEMAAAERATDPTISQIHLEMARLYRDMIDPEFRGSGGVTRSASPEGGQAVGAELLA